MKNSFLKKVTGVLRQNFREQVFIHKPSLAGSFVSAYWAHKSKPVVSAVVRHLNIQQDDNVLELGFGRAFGLDIALKKVLAGNGSICGVERSKALIWFAEQKLFTLYYNEFNRDKNLLAQKVLFHELKHSLLPFHEDEFEAIFHVDVFYGWNNREMDNFCKEMLRALRPGHLLICGMELRRLEEMAKYGVLHFEEFDPMRYIESLEKTGFEHIKLVYEKIDKNGNPCDDANAREIQIITAQKPTVSILKLDTESIWKTLEDEVEQEMVVERIQSIRSRPSSATVKSQKTLRELERELLQQEGAKS